MTILNKMALAIGLSATKVDFIDRVPPNYVADLDGTDDKITVDDNDVFTPNTSGADRGFTISSWVYYKNTSNPARGEHIVNKSGAFNLGAYRYEYLIRSGFDEKPFMIVYSGDNPNIYLRFKLDLVPDQATWYHLIFAWDLTADRTGWRAYVNGDKKTHGSGATHSSAGTWDSVTNGINLFVLGSNNSDKFSNIKIDEVAIFDNFISDSDASDLFSAGAIGDANEIDNLVAYYKFNENDGTTVNDSSNNSNEATFVNGTAFEQIEIP